MFLMFSKSYTNCSLQKKGSFDSSVKVSMYCKENKNNQNKWFYMFKVVTCSFRKKYPYPPWKGIGNSKRMGLLNDKICKLKV